jgi:hypothetical protein
LPVKKCILIVFLLFGTFLSKAQVEYNYKQYAIGVGASSIHGYTNLNQQDNHFAENINFTYYCSPYIPLTAEIQSGTLSGGSIITDPSKRQYTNNYLAFIFHGDFQLGQIIDNTNISNIAKNVYVGTGLGLISDNDKVQRVSLNDPTYTFPGKDKSINLMIPLRIGYEFKIFNQFNEPYIRINIGYEHNIVFGQGLDGYNDSATHFKNNAPDQYRQISLGIKYDFGNRTQ